MVTIITIFSTLNVIMLLGVLLNGQRIRRELNRRIDSIEIDRSHCPRGRR